jgi:hypothetical protein
MRCGPVLATTVLLLGAATAHAQPMPEYPFETDKPAVHGKRHATKPAAAAKPLAPLPPPRPTAANAEAAKAAPAKPEATKPNAVKPEPAKSEPAKLEPPKPEPVQTTPPSAPVKSAGNNAPRTSGVFADVPFAERIKIQAALLWSGDYVGAVNGEDPMLTAVKNYQKRIKAKITGALTPGERANLIAAARHHEQEFGWNVVIDPATGIRIGLPTKMVPHARDAARGTRWSSKHGEVQVETFRIKDPNLKLAALFEQEKKAPSSRRVEYSVLNDDNFFISGLQGLKKFSVRAKLRDGEVRGFTMLFDQMMETIVSPVMVAMASSFSPFPERTAPFAALSRSVEYGNGLVVSARGHIVTDRKLTEGCQVIVAAGLGDADRVADDKDKGLALLRVYGPRALSPLALARDLPKTSDLTLIGIPDPKEQNGAKEGGKEGGKKLTEIKARLVDGTRIELRQPVPMAGFSGAAALDAQGRFVGMTEMRNAVLASTEPAAPPVRLVTTATIREFIVAHGIDATRTSVGEAKASVVRIICVRK